MELRFNDVEGGSIINLRDVHGVVHLLAFVDLKLALTNKEHIFWVAASVYQAIAFEFCL